MASLEQIGIRRLHLYNRIEGILQSIGQRAGTVAPSMEVQAPVQAVPEQKELLANLDRVERIANFLEESMAAFPEKKAKKPA